MEKCPRADMHPVKGTDFSIAYDSHYGQKACHADGCTVLMEHDINDKNSHSYIKHDYKRGVAERIKVVNGVEKKVIRSYKLEVKKNG